MPITIAMTVSSIVVTSAWSTWLDRKYCPTMFHPYRVWVTVPRLTRAKTSALISIATSTATITIATHRPGCRTGTALISGGRVPAACRWSCAVTASADRAVDHWLGDPAALHAPLLEQLLVRAVLHQLFQRCLHGPCHAVALRQRDAVRRDLERLAGHLELAVGLLDDVGDDLRVSEAHLRPTAGHREVGAVLVAERQDGELLARRALLGLGLG